MLATAAALALATGPATDCLTAVKLDAEIVEEGLSNDPVTYPGEGHTPPFVLTYLWYLRDAVADGGAVRVSGLRA